MRTAAFLLLFSIPLATLAGELTLTIKGSQSLRGTLNLALFDSPANFPEGQPFASQRHDWAGGTGRFMFEGVPAGQYAVAVYLDTNGNGELDRNLFGIPSEPVGLSGDPGFGAPVFEDVAIRIGKDATTHTIQLD